MPTALTLVGLLAQIIMGLKNSSGQPLVPTAVSTAITAGESVVTSIIADIQAANTSGAGSQTAVTDYLQTLQALLTALSAEKVLSPQTVQLIGALGTALQAALVAEQQAQTVTNPVANLTPIDKAV